MRQTAEFQQRARMTQDERNRDAIDRVALAIKLKNDQLAGCETSYEEARKEAMRITHRSHGQ